MTGAHHNPKKGGYRLGTEIERTTDLRKVLEERILDSKVELSLREMLGIAKEFHDSIVDLVKRKRLLSETEPEKPVEVRTTHIEDMALEDELAESHYSRPHWARATTETNVEYQCIMDIFTLSSLIAQVRAICVNIIKGNCPN